MDPSATALAMLPKAVIGKETIRLLKIGHARLEHSQNLDYAATHDDEDEEGDESLAQRRVVHVLPRLPDGYVSTLLDIFAEFGISVAHGQQYTPTATATTTTQPI